jgi:hypothetical protein
LVTDFVHSKYCLCPVIVCWKCAESGILCSS